MAGWAHAWPKFVLKKYYPHSFLSSLLFCPAQILVKKNITYTLLSPFYLSLFVLFLLSSLPLFFFFFLFLLSSPPLFFSSSFFSFSHPSSLFLLSSLLALFFSPFLISYFFLFLLSFG
ncbi:unnamed protein product [Prunus armeniaca]